GAHEIKRAVQEFQHKGSFNCRAGNRLTSTLQFLKQNSFSITNKGQSFSSAPERLVERIKMAISKSKTRKIIIYTDGSTTPYLKHANSGCNVVITDINHKFIYEDGMPIRSDGNNFLAELARKNGCFRTAKNQSCGETLAELLSERYRAETQT